MRLNVSISVLRDEQSNNIVMKTETKKEKLLEITTNKTNIS